MQGITARTIPMWFATPKTISTVAVLMALLFSSAEGIRLMPYPAPSIPTTASNYPGLEGSRYSYNQTVRPERSSQAKPVKTKFGGQIGGVPAVALRFESPIGIAIVNADPAYRSALFRSYFDIGPTDTRGPPLA